MDWTSSLRALRRSPGFVLLATATLAAVLAEQNFDGAGRPVRV